MRMSKAAVGMTVAGLALLGCAEQDDPVASMRAWVQEQKPVPAHAMEPWPGLARDVGDGAAERNGLPLRGERDPFRAAAAMLASSRAGAPAVAQGPIYLGMLQRGNDTVAAVREGEAIELVRVGQRIGSGGARVTGITMQALTLRTMSAASAGAAAANAVQLPLEQGDAR